MNTEAVPVTSAMKIIDLSEDAETPASNSIEEATADSLRADIKYRGLALAVVLALFAGLNYAVMAFLSEAFHSDITRMAAQPPMPPADRLVDSKVLMALIGATAVQTGVGFVTIVSSLFPKRIN